MLSVMNSSSLELIRFWIFSSKLGSFFTEGSESDSSSMLLDLVLFVLSDELVASVSVSFVPLSSWVTSGFKSWTEGI
jgi:hypothetical protein